MLHGLAPSDWRRFNSLMDLESAVQRMHAADRLDIANAKLQPLFVKYGLCDSWGIVLLHRHWRLKQDEVALQEFTTRSGRHEYATRPVRKSSASIVPSTLRTSPKGQLQAIEFATHLVARRAYQALARRPAFVRELCEALVEWDLEDTFGLAAIKWTRPGRQWIELTNSGRTSIVWDAPKGEFRSDRLIPTSWQFFQAARESSSHMGCWATCVIPKNGSHYKDHKKTP